MKSLRCSLLAVVILFLSFLGDLMSCGGAEAVIRVGVLKIGVIDGDNMPNAKWSRGDFKKQEKLNERYQELFMSVLSKMETFEAVELKIDGSEIFTPEKPDKGKGYRPQYSHDMTDAAASQWSQRYEKLYITKARQAKCQYALDASATLSKSSNNEIVAEAFLYRLVNVETGEKFSLPIIRGTGTAALSSSTRAKRVSQAKTKGDKNSDSEGYTAKEQALVEAFNQALARMYDEITGDSAKVADVRANDVIINKGTASKVRVGDAYLVQAEISDGMDDVFGVAPDTTKRFMAMIKVKDVQENASVAEIVEGGGNINVIRAGDKLVPITAREVNRTLADFASGQYPPFPTNRPESKQAEVKTPATKQNTASKRTAVPKQTATKLDPLPALPPGMIRVGIVNFDNKAEGISDVEASTLTDLLSRMLSNSEKIAVLERERLEAVAREQKLTLSGIIDPATAAKVGKLAGCQYILLGSVTGLQERDTISGQYIRPTDASAWRYYNVNPNAVAVAAGISLLGKMISAIEGQGNRKNVVTETHEVIADVDARLVNVATSQIAAAFSEQGSAAQSDVITQDSEGNIKSVESSYGSLQSQAITSAASNLSHRIRENLTGEQVQIASVNGDEIIINRGSASGVQTGDLFCVYSEGQSDGDTEAILSVTDVQEAFSTAELAKSTTASYSPAPGYRLEPVLHSDFQRGLWHIKNQKRVQGADKAKQNLSLEELSRNSSKKNRLEVSSTEAKKVIKGYGLDAKKEKELIDAHSKAANASSAKKKYESYKKLSDADINDYLAAYNTGKYALELSMYVEAREWASKALFVNPRYKPAKELIEKIDKGE